MLGCDSVKSTLQKSRNVKYNCIIKLSMGNRRAPAFGRISGAGKSSLRARDADQGRGQRGRGKRLLNRGMTVGKNQNYIKRDEMALYGSRGEDPNGREKTEDHELAAKLGFELFTDGPDRLGWLLNMNSVRFISIFMVCLLTGTNGGGMLFIFLCRARRKIKKQGIW